MLFGKIRPSGAKLQAAKYGPLKNCSGCFLMTSQAGGCGHKNDNGLRLIKQSPNKKTRRRLTAAKGVPTRKTD